MGEPEGGGLAQRATKGAGREARGGKGGQGSKAGEGNEGQRWGFGHAYICLYVG